MMLDKIDLNICNMRHLRFFMLTLLVFVGGCTSAVVVKPDIPAPLVQKLPLNASLVYTDAFKDYVYLENEKKRGNLKSLDFTDAQVAMFDQVFGSLTNLVETDDSAMNLSIEPQILDFQYTAPSETKLKQYEIWIKYRLKLRDAQNASIADWTIKGYGKTPTGLLTSASSAFNAATNIALRDVGAQLLTRFPRQRVVKTLLDGGVPTPIPEFDPKPQAEPKVELAANEAKAEAVKEDVGEQPTFDDGKQNEVPDGAASDDESNADVDEQPSADSGKQTDAEGSDET